MTFLLVDSSTERASCALFVEEKLAGRQDIPFGYSNTGFLLPAISDLFKKMSCTPSDLHFIACGLGPGSFTGIRVSCALAKGMQQGLNIPVVGVSTLHGFIPEASFEGRFMSVIDARMGGAFVQEGVCCGGEVLWEGSELLVSIEELGKRLLGVSLLVTPHLAPLINRLGLDDFPSLERGLDVEYMGKEALIKFRAGGPFLCEPVYLRATQAEIDAERRQHKT